MAKHQLQMCDEVVAKFPDFRAREDNPWFSGIVLGVNAEEGTCKIRFCDGDIGEGVLASEVLFCPSGRAEDFGKGHKRGSTPENAVSVAIGDGGDEDDVDWIDEAITKYEAGETDWTEAGGCRFVLAKGHETWPRIKKAQIIRGMQDACEYYNKYGTFDRLMVAHFDVDCGTACAGPHGHIRFGGALNFGGGAHKDVTRVAMHEISHVFGVGLHGKWRDNMQAKGKNHEKFGGQGIWTGEHACAVYEKWKQVNGGQVLKAGGSEEIDAIYSDGLHFWPGGFAYTREWQTEDDVQFHIEMVHAMRRDCDDAGADSFNRAERQRTMLKRGMYFFLSGQGSDAVHWSQSTGRGKMRCDETWSRSDAAAVAHYLEHRKSHLMPADFTHIEQLGEDESEVVEQNTANVGDGGKDDDEEDESEEFVVSYTNGCDRVWVANAEVGGRLKIIEATWGSSAAKAVVCTSQVQDRVADGRASGIGEMLTFGSETPIFSGDALGDPEPGVGKTFKCIFSDGVPGTPGSFFVQYRDKKAVDANWAGGGPNSAGPVDIAHRGRELWVERATWGVNDVWTANLDVTEKVRTMVMNGRLWSDTVQIGQLLPDPAEGECKIFTVKFTCL
mmetsp:Transcript_20366/g.51431  ORF Transcript_20366/g.51431 Transcript_20366/m.51431 type:complete len:613 (+) Transcript_20366:190-2028(+)